MISRTSAEFRRRFRLRRARDAFRLFRANPGYPGLRFKKLPPHEDLWSSRISRNYRAIGRVRGGVILWFFVGSHEDYDAVLKRR